MLSAVENRFLQSSVLASERTINIQIKMKLLSAVSQLEQLRLDSTEYNQLRLLSLIKGIHFMNDFNKSKKETIDKANHWSLSMDDRSRNFNVTLLIGF